MPEKALNESQHAKFNGEHDALLDRKLGVLSIQLPSMGHRVFGNLLRRAFSASADIDFRAFWTDQEREPYARVINQLLRQRLPSGWAEERNIDLRRTRADLGYAYYARRLVQRMQKRFQVDIMHFHTQTAALLSTDFIRRIPTVITIDQTATQIAQETPLHWRWTHRSDILLERSPLQAAAAVVPFSTWAARSVMQQHTIPPERVHIVPIGVELSHFVEFTPEMRSVRDSGPVKILFVGSDFRRKGGSLLVDVFIERFAERDVELHLVTAAKTRVPDHPKIFVHRNIDAFSPAWKKLYGDADIFVLPTRWEAFGIVFLEAMAAGLPVIGTTVGAIPELVLEDENGYLITKDDRQQLSERLELLLSNPGLRRRLGENGRRRVHQYFEAAACAARLHNVFASIARTA